MANELSQHRHISFTAHYTGYRWYLQGISHPAFATSKGKFLNTLLHPLENWAEHKLGGSMRTVLEQRHRIIDQQLDQLLERHPDLQVVEIAAGLSPRGWHYRQQVPQLRYIEVDLPDMAASKRTALAQAGQPEAEVLAIDLFTPQLDDLFACLDQERPVVIISEGLVNYFSQHMLHTLWSRLAAHGRQFVQFYYLTDLCPEPVGHRHSKLVTRSGQLLRWMSKSAFAFHFARPAELIAFMQMCGFEQVQVLQPADLSMTDPQQHLGDFVWIVRATV